jgi:amino acid transporter
MNISCKIDSSSGFRRELGTFDVTLLVLGAVVGADVYIVAGLGAGFLGPAQLLAWLGAGVLSALIGLAFVQCAAICPEVGGSYAYARAAFGPLGGFLAGWTLYLGEWVALPIFPLAFINYLAYFVPGLTPLDGLAIKVLLVTAVTVMNILSINVSGRANDVLALTKLVPLALLIVVGLAFAMFRPHEAARHLTPFTPIGWSGFGSAVLLIFWAYAGFEMAVLPAAEVKDARRTLPRGLILGITIATIFYLLTSFAVGVALPWQVAAASGRPLADALGAMLASLGFPAEIGLVLASLGALVSIVSVYAVFTLTLARLSYAMAIDGVLPAPFARLHPKFRTPHVGLLFQAGSTLVIAPVVDVVNLIGIAIFFLGLCYVLTALSALRLLTRAPTFRLHLRGVKPALGLAAVGSAYLSAQAPWRLMAIGAGLVALGLVGFRLRGEVSQRLAPRRAR